MSVKVTAKDSNGRARYLAARKLLNDHNISFYSDKWKDGRTWSIKPDHFLDVYTKREEVVAELDRLADRKRTFRSYPGSDHASAHPELYADEESTRWYFVQ